MLVVSTGPTRLLTAKLSVVHHMQHTQCTSRNRAGVFLTLEVGGPSAGPRGNHSLLRPVSLAVKLPLAVLLPLVASAFSR